MSKIIITETDLTSNVAVQEITDVVFIPGFGDGTSEGVAKQFVPTLCRTIAEFNTYFGSTPQKFASAQPYPARSSSGGTNTDGFQSYAIPQQGNMFEANAPDPSYIMAKELIRAGIPVLYERMNGVFNNETYDVSVTGAYKAFKNVVFKFTAATQEVPSPDRNADSVLIQKDYQVKYITSGGYPTCDYDVYVTSDWNSNILSKNMARIAAERGDAVALIDHTNNPERVLTGTNSVFDYLNGTTGIIGDTLDTDTYAAMFTPWGTYSLSADYGVADGTMDFAGSYAYLKSLAKSLKTNPNWYAIAGASRGAVPGLLNLNTDNVLTNSIANYYQPSAATTENTHSVCINAITNVRPYGLCIWGNRTLRDQKLGRDGYAIGFLNLRNAISDIKKQAHLAAISLMFEQNNDTLWVNFKAMLTPLLDQMVSGNGISGYKIIKNTSDSKTKLNASIKIYPIYAVEEFEIGIQITDEEVSVE